MDILCFLLYHRGYEVHMKHTLSPLLCFVRFLLLFVVDSHPLIKASVPPALVYLENYGLFVPPPHHHPG